MVAYFVGGSETLIALADLLEPSLGRIEGETVVFGGAFDEERARGDEDVDLGDVAEFEEARGHPAGAVRDAQHAFGGAHPAADYGGLDPKVAGGEPHAPFAAHAESGDANTGLVDGGQLFENVDEAHEIPELVGGVITMPEGGGERDESAFGKFGSEPFVFSRGVVRLLAAASVAVQAEDCREGAVAGWYCECGFDLAAFIGCANDGCLFVIAFFLEFACGQFEGRTQLWILCLDDLKQPGSDAVLPLAGGRGVFCGERHLKLGGQFDGGQYQQGCQRAEHGDSPVGSAFQQIMPWGADGRKRRIAATAIQRRPGWNRS